MMKCIFQDRGNYVVELLIALAIMVGAFPPSGSRQQNATLLPLHVCERSL